MADPTDHRPAEEVGSDASPEADGSVDVDAVIEEIRRTVEAKREEGFYPPGLEDDLEAHFRRIVSHRHEVDTSRLRASVERLNDLAGLSPTRIPTDSGFPGGSALHRLVAKAVARQTQGVLEQVEELSTVLRSVISDLADAIGRADTHLHIDLLGQVDAVQERLSALERQPMESPAGLAELGRRLERLEAREAARAFRPTYSSAAFEAAFRGTELELKDRYRDLAYRFEGLSPVLDIGCGRGEMIELLAEIGVESRGVEIDPALVADARSRGLEVSEGDGLAHLGGLPDASLGGLSLIQVVEHLSAQQVVDLVSLAVDKLRPGGRAIIETVNPQSLYVYARSFYLDPTHGRPVHPAYLAFLFEQAGFGAIEIDWRSAPSDKESLVPVGDPLIDLNIDRLNSLLFAPQDYALIATR